MMITDNFDYLAQLFDDLKSKEDFYYVQVIQRKTVTEKVNVLLKTFISIIKNLS